MLARLIAAVPALTKVRSYRSPRWNRLSAAMRLYRAMVDIAFVSRFIIESGWINWWRFATQNFSNYSEDPEGEGFHLWSHCAGCGISRRGATGCTRPAQFAGSALASGARCRWRDQAARRLRHRTAAPAWSRRCDIPPPQGRHEPPWVPIPRRQTPG